MPYGAIAQSLKFVPVIQPQVIADDALLVGSVGSTPVSVDTAGWGYATVVFQIGAIDATIALMNVYECDTSGGTYTEIPSCDFVADTTSEPTANDDNKVYLCHIRLGGSRKRYLQVELKAGNGNAGTYAAVMVVLSDPDIVPNSASEQGAAARIIKN